MTLAHESYCRFEYREETRPPRRRCRPACCGCWDWRHAIATAGTGPSAPATDPITRPSSPNDPLENGVIGFVNAIRGENGCGFVADSDRLNGAARFHSSDMVRRNYFSHVTPDGVTLDIRVAEEGFNASIVGENIAKGCNNPTDVVLHWMDNPDDRAVILELQPHQHWCRRRVGR
jgi:uncharacterized protein YkwD